MGMRNSAPRVRSRREAAWRWLAIGGIAALVVAPAGWFATDVLEQDDDFCNACHLSDGVPLHTDIRRDYEERPPAALAALHANALLDSRPEDPVFRCIDCHGGATLPGKVRVKALAAKDAFFWAIGRFEEPTHMAWPLWDEDCSQCHPGFQVKADEYEEPAFHDLAVHNVELGVDCVECHTSHIEGGNPAAYFLLAAAVRRQCARCHPEFEEGAE